MSKEYFSFRKDDMLFLFSSCASAIEHALKMDLFSHIKTKDDLYFEVEHLFHMKTIEEAKRLGNYEVIYR